MKNKNTTKLLKEKKKIKTLININKTYKSISMLQKKWIDAAEKNYYY